MGIYDEKCLYGVIFMDDISFLYKYEAIILPTGSRIICDPPPTDTDQDYVVYIAESNASGLPGDLTERGFELDNPNEHYRPEKGMFNSWRKDDINLIITFNLQFFENFKEATRIAKYMNIRDKETRIALFQAILYGR